jgi:hypothetical protein
MTSVYDVRTTAGEERLVRITDGGAEQPLVDNIVSFEVQPDSPNPMQIRRLSVRLRVQAPTHLRGRPSYLFARAGSATGPSRWLPDVELRTDIAIRNGSRSW